MIDQTSRKFIDTLLPGARPWAEAFLSAVESSGQVPAGTQVRIISGNRTWAEQDKLYSYGRTDHSRGKVTNARGGQSNHNFGVAWDIGIFVLEDGKWKYRGEHPLYAKLGPIGRGLGLEWGGDWKSFKDTPHYQVKTGLSLAEMRNRVLRKVTIPLPTVGATPQPVIDPVVEVWEGGNKTTIRAFLRGNRVYVAVRDFVERFGGAVLDAGPESFTISLNGEQGTYPGFIAGSTGYVMFADVQAVLGWPYTYDARKLSIITEEK